MSIITEIIDWVKERPIFWQEAVGRIIQKNKLSEEDFLELATICKAEKRLLKYSENLIDLEKLKESLVESETVYDISLLKIFSIENIKALQNNSEIAIEENGLTVIYGDNGSGKSSFVSVLMQVCSTRGSIPSINKNLFKDSAEQQNQKARIQYKIGEDIKSITWENGNYDSEILKAVHIFDNKSASSYIEGEDEIAFTPSGLVVIEQLAHACNKIEEILRKEIESLKLKQIDYSFLITEEDNDIQTFLKNLNARSDIKKLDEIANFTTENDKLLITTEQNIAELKTLDQTKKISENNNIIARLNSLKTRYEQIIIGLSSEKINEIEKDILNHKDLQNAIKALTEETFSDLPLEKIGSQPWRELWESAKRFYKYSTGKEFPDSDAESMCPLCLQDLDNETTKTRLLNFEKFVQTDIQTQLNTVNDKLKVSEQEIQNINLDFSEIQTTINELNDIDNSFGNLHDECINTINQYKISIADLFTDRKVEEFEKKEISISLIQKINEVGKKIEEENKILLERSVEKELDEQNKTLSLLKSRKNLFENKEKIIEEIKRLQILEILLLCAHSCNTRNISLFSNVLSSKYITETLKENFTGELSKLGFSSIKVNSQTRADTGKQYHFLELDSSYSSSANLKEILSEGEHRCISLATFLSELSISEHKSSIIFDDPVSSLDHKWRRKIAKRIVEEASVRQVIVFTHDITFLMNLQEFSDDLNIQSLTRKKHVTGITSENPPWDALSTIKRIGILKQLLQQLEKIGRTETDEIFKEKSRMFYGKLRETWERCIEEVVLNQTVQRFGRSIQTKRLKLVTDLSVDDYNTIDSNMEKCSTYFYGHDSAGELLEEVPAIDEIENDLNILDEFRKTILRRRQ